jgi:hypothetical protein
MVSAVYLRSLGKGADLFKQDPALAGWLTEHLHRNFDSVPGQPPMEGLEDLMAALAKIAVDRG